MKSPCLLNLHACNLLRQRRSRRQQGYTPHRDLAFEQDAIRQTLVKLKFFWKNDVKRYSFPKFYVCMLEANFSRIFAGQSMVEGGKGSGGNSKWDEAIHFQSHGGAHYKSQSSYTKLLNCFIAVMRQFFLTLPHIRVQDASNHGYGFYWTALNL